MLWHPARGELVLGGDEVQLRQPVREFHGSRYLWLAALLGTQEHKNKLVSIYALLSCKVLRNKIKSWPLCLLLQYNPFNTNSGYFVVVLYCLFNTARGYWILWEWAHNFICVIVIAFIIINWKNNLNYSLMVVPWSQVLGSIVLTERLLEIWLPCHQLIISLKWSHRWYYS